MRVFVDTNLWVYPLDHREPEKAHFVSQWLRERVETDDVVISTQVMIELRSVLTRKLKPAYSPEDTRDTLAALAQFDVVPTHAELVQDAHELATTTRLPWFDALIAEAALRGGCTVLYSEDFSHEQMLGNSLQIQNPFLTT